MVQGRTDGQAETPLTCSEATLGSVSCAFIAGLGARLGIGDGSAAISTVAERSNEQRRCREG